MTAGRRWAYAGAGLGVGLSVAANVEHVLVQGRDAGLGPVVSAAACPVILLVALEIIARMTWPSGLRWRLLRWLALPTVGVVAASISYLHMRALLLVYRESSWAATVGPLAVDGLMAVALGAVLVPVTLDTQSRSAPEAESLVDAEQVPVALATPATQARRPRPPAAPRDLQVARGADAGRALVFEHLRVAPSRQADLVRATGLARRTVRDHLEALAAQGVALRDGNVYRANGHVHVPAGSRRDDDATAGEGL